MDHEGRQGGRHFSAFGGLRSFVDLFSNTLILDRLDFAQDFKTILEGRLPLYLLQDFLHEATHHWCFLSPVGSAMTLLKFRAKHGGFRRRTVRAFLEPEARLKTAVTLLRPIAEGLALFSEFDILPGTGDVRAPTLQWLLYLFDRGEQIPDAAGADAALRAWLIGARSADECVAKKEHVLTQPLNLSRDGYLVGYLTIKTAWNRFKARSCTPADAELFACYARSYFYDDIELAQLLLHDTPEVVDGIIQIVDHIQRRILNFADTDLGPSIQAYHEVIRRIGPHRPVHNEGAEFGLKTINLIPHLDLDPSVLPAAQREFERAMRDLSGDTDAMVSRILAQRDRCIFAQRELIWLGGTQGKVFVNEHGHALFYPPGSSWFLSSPALKGTGAQEAEATLDAFFSSQYHHIAFVVSVKAKPVLVLITDDKSPILEQEYANGIADRAQYMAWAQQEDSVYRKFLGKQTAGGLLAAAERQALAISWRTYSSAALRGIPESLWGKVCTAMDSRGFWTLLNEDLASLRQLAVAGLLSSMPPSERGTTPLAELHDPELMLQVGRSLVEHGFPLEQIDSAALSVCI